MSTTSITPSLPTLRVHAKASESPGAAGARGLERLELLQRASLAVQTRGTSAPAQLPEGCPGPHARCLHPMLPLAASLRRALPTPPAPILVAAVPSLQPSSPAPLLEPQTEASRLLSCGLFEDELEELQELELEMKERSPKVRRREGRRRRRKHGSGSARTCACHPAAAAHPPIRGLTCWCHNKTRPRPAAELYPGTGAAAELTQRRWARPTPADLSRARACAASEVKSSLPDT